MNRRTKQTIAMTAAATLIWSAVFASTASAFIIPSKPVTTVPPVAVNPEPPIVEPPLPPVEPPPPVNPPPPPDTGNPPPETNNPPPPVNNVPEPGTLLLGLSAVGIAGWYRRRK